MAETRNSLAIALVLSFLGVTAGGGVAAAQPIGNAGSTADAPSLNRRTPGSSLAVMRGSTTWAGNDEGAVPSNLPQQHILMMLKRSAKQEQALEQYMKDQYDPRSSDFHKWLTPEEFGALYGPSNADIDRLTLWLHQRGFQINRVAAGRTFIDFSGTAGQLAAAFQTPIHWYRFGGVRHTGNSRAPVLPPALAPFVNGFRALNNVHPKPMLGKPGVARLDRQNGKWSRILNGHVIDSSNPGGPNLVGPQDYAEIYGVNQAWQQSIDTPDGPQNLVGTGQTIAIVGDTDLATSDIQSFRDEFGISSLGPNGSVQLDHPPPNVCPLTDPTLNDPEGYLDAEWAGAMAPDATVDFVSCGDSGVTSGTDLAAAYIVNDAAHVLKSAVLSSSYGYCEQDPTTPSNFYTSLWQQAAAEGITVVVAAGDSGPTECDEFGGLPYAQQGFGINAEASTPYNIAAGGTDFSDVFSGTASTYWSASNDENLQSALSYIPEMPWNDSCASPFVLQKFGQGFSQSWGENGFCKYASQQPVDPNTAYSPYFLFFAGSGGSSILSPRPSWQTGVPGIPDGSARVIPDISMFASSGYAWGHTLLLCDTGWLPDGYTCDITNPDNIYFNEDGGTSFVAPAIAGIMALISQKSGRQGQANNVLYPLAAQQFVAGAAPGMPSLATCAAYLGNEVSPLCYFHDVSATPNPDPATDQQTPFLFGNTSVPCTGSASAPGVYTDTSNNPASDTANCFGYQITVTSQNGINTTTPDYYGVISTADNSSSPAFQATPGYDLATGLGSPNAAVLINAPQWSTGGLATHVGLSVSQNSIAPTGHLQLTAQVTAASGGDSVLAGSVAFYSSGNNNPLGTASLSCDAEGQVTLSVDGQEIGENGSSNNLYAVYSGGTDQCGNAFLNYYGAQSASQSITVTDSSESSTHRNPRRAITCCHIYQPTLFHVVLRGDLRTPTGTLKLYRGSQLLAQVKLTPQSNRSSSAVVAIDPDASQKLPIILRYSGNSIYSPSESPIRTNPEDAETEKIERKSARSESRIPDDGTEVRIQARRRN